MKLSQQAPSVLIIGNVLLIAAEIGNAKHYPQAATIALILSLICFGGYMYLKRRA